MHGRLFDFDKFDYSHASEVSRVVATNKNTDTRKMKF